MWVRLSVVVCLLAALFTASAYAQTNNAAGLAIPATTSAINSATPLSQRVVAYDMDAKYNAKAHSLDARKRLPITISPGSRSIRFPSIFI